MSPAAALLHGYLWPSTTCYPCHNVACAKAVSYFVRVQASSIRGMPHAHMHLHSSMLLRTRERAGVPAQLYHCCRRSLVA